MSMRDPGLNLIKIRPTCWIPSNFKKETWKVPVQFLNLKWKASLGTKTKRKRFEKTYRRSWVQTQSNKSTFVTMIWNSTLTRPRRNNMQPKWWQGALKLSTMRLPMWPLEWLRKSTEWVCIILLGSSNLQERNLQRTLATPVLIKGSQRRRKKASMINSLL